MISPGSYDFHGGPNQNPGVEPSDVKKLYVKKAGTTETTYDPLSLSDTDLNLTELAFTRPKDLATATEADLVPGNYLAIDGSAGTKKLPAKDIAKRSVQDKLLSDLALDFDPTRTVSNPYKRYDIVRHDNHLYMFKTDHYGAWDASKVEVARLSTLFTDLLYADPKSLYNAWNPDITDLNNVKKTCVLNVWPSGSLNLANMPSDYGAGSGLIFTFKFGYGAGAPAIYQIIRKHTTGDIWQRLFANGSWSAWSSIKTPQINEYLHCIGRALYNTWNTDITDFNSVPDNSAIVYYPYSGDSLVVANVPSDYGYGSGILTTETASYGIGATLKMQILTKFSTQERWTRQYANATWGAWTKHEFAKKNTVEIGAGKQYTTLRAGFAAALALNNAEVIVYPGTYDLVQECSDILANTLTVSYSPCVVGHGMHVKFMAGAKAVANIVKGDMSDAQFDSIRTYFEPFGFRTNGGDFTLENVVIEATDTRYCVHDDPGGQNVTYTHKYINCKMTYHSSNVETDHIFRSCIGGGLGKHGTILVDGGVYKSDVATGISYVENGDPDYAQVAIFYHNGNIADAESSVTITNVFFEDKGYVVAQSYGPSTKMTKFVVSNSHFGLPIRETYSVSPNVEVEAQWNNDIATPGHWVVASGSTTFVAD